MRRSPSVTPGRTALTASFSVAVEQLTVFAPGCSGGEQKKRSFGLLSWLIGVWLTGAFVAAVWLMGVWFTGVWLTGAVCWLDCDWIRTVGGTSASFTRAAPAGAVAAAGVRLAVVTTAAVTGTQAENSDVSLVESSRAVAVVASPTETGAVRPDSVSIESDPLASVVCC